MDMLILLQKFQHGAIKLVTVEIFIMDIHALGFADNNNANSIMDFDLTSQNQTLSSRDVTTAQFLYGMTSGSAQIEASYLKLVQAMASFGADSGAATSSNVSESSLLANTATFTANPLTHAQHMAKPTIVKPLSAAPQKQIKLSVVDNPSAPDLFVDEAIGFMVRNNTVRITFASIKVDHTKNPGMQSCVVSGRLVMPIATAESLHKLLGTVLDKIKSQKAEKTDAHTLQ